MIAIDARESEVMREAFLLYLRRRSVGKVRSELDRLGQRNRRERPFSWQALRNILGNDFYIGVTRHGQTVTKKGEHEAIVNKIVFGKAQKQLSRA